MATKTQHKRKNPRGPSSQKGKEARIEDVSVESLIFTSSKRSLSTDVAEAIEEATLEETMHGASALKLTLVDGGSEALRSGLLETRVRCTLDGAPFRLVQPNVPEMFKLGITFEHALVAEMREHTSPKKARRGTVTRAEFMLSMLRELKLPFVLVCPELHRKQKTPKPERYEVTITRHGNGKTSTSKHRAKAASAGSAGVVTDLSEVGKGPGPATVTKSPTKALTSKGKALTREQTDVANQGLEGARNVNANRLSMAALVVALIQENNLSNKSATPEDLGALSLLESTAHGIQKKSGSGTINPFDVTEVCEHFCTAGFTGAGGSNAIARAHPSWTPARIGSVVQGPAKPYPESWNAEAFAIVDAFLATGVGGSASASPSFSGGGASTTQSQSEMRTATYEFTRGTPGQRESTFECCLRLAEEVNWRFFISGRNEIYFVSDDDLIKAAPRYVIHPDSPGFIDLTGDVEVGARTIIENGKRNPKPSEASLIVRAERWGAPPGCVIEIADYGPFNGPWLVDEVDRGLFDAETQIHLRAPQHPLEEPKATASGTGTPGKEIVGGQGGAEDPTQHAASGEPQASRSVERKLAQQHPELHAKVRAVVAIILTQYPQLAITSTTGGSHVSDSYHYRGMAADLAGSNMDAIGSWIARTLTHRLTEGIHNPTLAVKNGAAVNGPTFYSSVWEGHKDHLHIAVAG